MNRLVEEFNKINLCENETAICRLGQHSFILKFARTIVYVDPYLSPSPKRLIPPLIAPEELSNADIITGSHDHSDHIDRPAFPKFASASPNAVFVIPRAVREKVIKATGVCENRIIGINAGETISLKNIEISAIPSAHELLDYDEKTGLYPYLGYVFKGNGVAIYHSGDCCLYEGIHAQLRKSQIDVMILPINGRDAERLRRGCLGNMTFQEAVDLAGALKPLLTIPAHYDMFEGNTVDPMLFMDYMQVKYPQLKTVLLPPGEIFIFKK